MRASCQCGAYAIGECVGCGRPLCARHGRRYAGQRLLCALCGRELVEEAVAREREIDRTSWDEAVEALPNDPFERILAVYTRNPFTVPSPLHGYSKDHRERVAALRQRTLSSTDGPAFFLREAYRRLLPEAKLRREKKRSMRSKVVVVKVGVSQTYPGSSAPNDEAQYNDVFLDEAGSLWVQGPFDRYIRKRDTTASPDLIEVVARSVAYRARRS